MNDVERQKMNTPQAEVHRLGTQNLQRSQNLDWSKEEVAHLRAHYNEFGHHLEPTQYTRYEGYLFQKLEWMHMEEHQLGSAATGGGGLGADETTWLKWWSRVRLQQRETACLVISKVLAALHVLEIPGQPLQVQFLCSKPEQVERHDFQEKGS